MTRILAMNPMNRCRPAPIRHFTALSMLLAAAGVALAQAPSPATAPTAPTPSAATATPASQLPTASSSNAGTIAADHGPRIRLVDEWLPDGGIERRFTSGTQVLYRGRIQPTPTGLTATVAEGHPSQLGTLVLAGAQLTVTDAQGKPLWSETLNRPLCLPELHPEFIGAQWDRLAVGAEPLACGIPILKARKVARVQWERLPDGPGGERIVELQPGTLGMRLFLRPTRLTFSPDGQSLLAQSGQFESVRDPASGPRYLQGRLQFDRPRDARRWALTRFGPPDPVTR